MTNEQKIREACIKANPEIMELKFGCRIRMWGYDDNVFLRKIDKYGYEWQYLSHSGQLESCNNAKPEILGREIRLSDVLMAIGDKGLFSASIGGSIVSFIWNYKQPHEKHKHFTWNLLRDNLSEQTEETKAFIASLLQE